MKAFVFLVSKHHEFCCRQSPAAAVLSGPGFPSRHARGRRCFRPCLGSTPRPTGGGMLDDMYRVSLTQSIHTDQMLVFWVFVFVFAIVFLLVFLKILFTHLTWRESESTQAQPEIREWLSSVSGAFRPVSLGTPGAADPATAALRTSFPAHFIPPCFLQQRLSLKTLCLQPEGDSPVKPTRARRCQIPSFQQLVELFVRKMSSI